MPPVPAMRRAATREIGRPGMTAIGGGLLPWAAFMDDREYAPDVKWPKSIATYARMQTDAQLKGLLLATTLPIRRFLWEIDPNGAQPKVVDHIAASYNLPIRGQEPEPIRRRRRFSHDRHLSHALRALPYGHFFFEQVYDYADPAEGGDGLLHLRKLGTRPPRTIADILLEDDGGLKGIKQNVHADFKLDDEMIGVNRLLAYVWDGEDDGDWIGRSMLRACFRNWLVKDRLIRIDATKHERNGMGIPWFEVDPAASAKQIAELAEVARAMRAGEESGAAGPGKLHLKGVEGSVPDTVASIREHDHQMSRAFLAMFFELGTSESGSRALSGDFIDFHNEAVMGTAEWYRDITQAHGIEDEVELNWGPDEQPPLLSFTRLEGSELGIADLSTAVEKGLIAVDPELSEYIVRRWRLPRGAGEPPTPTPAPPAPPEPPPAPPAAARRAASGPRRTILATQGEIPLPARELRRQPYEQEVRAQVDFASLEATFLSERDSLVAAVRAAQQEQIDALVAAVQANAGDATALASLQVDPIDAAIISSRLREAGRQGIDSASSEREAQLAQPVAAVRAQDAEEADEDAVNARADDRADAMALLLAAAIAQAASHRASSVAQMSADDAAAAVRDHLEGLSPAFLEEQLGGATWEAFNTGRREFMRANSPENVYASELLDSNTCSPCISVDGTEWGTVEQAEASAYPQGGYVFCQGGLRCRGTLVATY